MIEKLPIPITLALLVLASGCATSRIGKAYQGLVISKQANEIALEEAERLKEEGRLSASRLSQISEIGLKWAETHNAATLALEAYAISQNPADLERVEKLRALLIQLVAQIRDLLGNDSTALKEMYEEMREAIAVLEEAL